MKLYQIPKGDVFTTFKEIGDTDDGWCISTSSRPPDDAMVEVVYRDGDREGPTPAHDFDWGLNHDSATVMAYRIIQPKLQLEIGGIYKDRNGEIHGPLDAFAHSTYKFAAGSSEPTWTADGQYAVGVRDDLDLIEHIATVPGDGWKAWNEPHCPFSSENPVLEVVTRAGTINVGTNARPAKTWYWGPTQVLIVAYRVVHPTPKLTLTLAERVASLEARFDAI